MFAIVHRVCLNSAILFGQASGHRKLMYASFLDMASPPPTSLLSISVDAVKANLET